MISKICDALVWLIILAVMLAAGLLLVPRLLGYEIYGVLSGSMEPTFRVGSVIYVKPSAPEEVFVGDPITYTFDLQGQDELMITHRVLEKDDTARQFITKGDANSVADLAPVSYDRLVGRALYTIPHLGSLTVFMQSRQGFFAGVGILLVVLALSAVGILADSREAAAQEEGSEAESAPEESSEAAPAQAEASPPPQSPAPGEETAE